MRLSSKEPVSSVLGIAWAADLPWLLDEVETTQRRWRPLPRSHAKGQRAGEAGWEVWGQGQQLPGRLLNAQLEQAEETQRRVRPCCRPEPPAWRLPSHCHAFLPVVVFSSEYPRLSWLLYPGGGAGTGTEDKASYVMEG